MIPPVNSLVRYNNPILVATAKSKKPDAKVTPPPSPPSSVSGDLIPPVGRARAHQSSQPGLNLAPKLTDVLREPHIRQLDETVNFRIVSPPRGALTRQSTSE
jgi:hypothetical protein